MNVGLQGRLNLEPCVWEMLGLCVMLLVMWNCICLCVLAMCVAVSLCVICPLVLFKVAVSLWVTMTSVSLQ